MRRCVPTVLDDGTADDEDQAVAVCLSMWSDAQDKGEPMNERLTVSFDLKAVNDREIVGHGSVFGNVDLGGDVVMPGAFAKSLNEHSAVGSAPKMFWMHDPKLVLGKWTSVQEDAKGLAVRGVLAPTQLGDEIRTHLKMGSIDGLSIGYRTRKATFNKAGHRLLHDVELGEISVVSMQMNPLATVEHVKSRLSARGEYVPTGPEFERILREAGCSREVAKRIAYKVRTFDDESGERSDASPREVGQDEAARALSALADQMLATAIGKRFGA